MQIPDSFKSILEKNQGYNGIINITISQFESYIKNRQPEFFPDYTEHGIEHIESVLFATEWLMKDSINFMSDKDITVLILSVLLHDYGMFITYEGFVTLLNSNNKVDHFDEKSWSQLWEEYKNEVRRWDDKRQKAVCGKKFDTTNITLDGDLKDSTKKVIGEFLRIYHPRLAHEIALFGFPGVEGNLIKFGSNLENELIDLAGLIARSHGLNLRDTFDYINNRFFNLREPHSVKAIFLMVLLRIADYLQFTAERAPSSSFDIRKISSPYSRLQWSIHNSIKNISHNNHDPELLQVIAFPETAYEYLELNKLFKGIQQELDHSWAVIGEVYGENNELSKLKIKLRRIRSNIEEVGLNPIYNTYLRKLHSKVAQKSLNYLFNHCTVMTLPLVLESCYRTH